MNALTLFLLLHLISAQTSSDSSRFTSSTSKASSPSSSSSSTASRFKFFGRKRIVAVVGAGHMEGILRHLKTEQLQEQEFDAKQHTQLKTTQQPMQQRQHQESVVANRMREISSSSLHPLGTWPGRGLMRVISNKQLLHFHQQRKSLLSPVDLEHKK